MTTLPYIVHGLTLALAWFTLLSLAMTAAVAVAASVLTKRAGRSAPGLWLALRLSPAVLSLVFVAGVFLPSYWKYEPLEVEGFDVTLTLLAIVALGILGAAVVRGVAAWRRAAQRANDWMRVAASCGRGC